MRAPYPEPTTEEIVRELRELAEDSEPWHTRGRAITNRACARLESLAQRVRELEAELEEEYDRGYADAWDGVDDEEMEPTT